MAAVTGVERIVLPSPNGSTITRALAGTGARVVAGSLRNASAVADHVAPLVRDGATCVVVPAGERWPDDTLRPCVEDLWGAGAVLAGLLARGVDRPEPGGARGHPRLGRGPAAGRPARLRGRARAGGGGVRRGRGGGGAGRRQRRGARAARGVVHRRTPLSRGGPPAAAREAAREAAQARARTARTPCGVRAVRWGGAGVTSPPSGGRPATRRGPAGRATVPR